MQHILYYFQYNSKTGLVETMAFFPVCLWGKSILKSCDKEMEKNIVFWLTIKEYLEGTAQTSDENDGERCVMGEFGKIMLTYLMESCLCVEK